MTGENDYQTESQDGKKEDIFESAFTGTPPDWIKYEKHPSRRTLVDYIYQDLEAPDFTRVDVHVATCEPCFYRTQKLRKALQDLSDGLYRLLQWTIDSQK